MRLRANGTKNTAIPTLNHSYLLASSILLTSGIVSAGLWLVSAPAIAYDVNRAILMPNPANDPPAQTVSKVTKPAEQEGDPDKIEEKILLPRNDKLQQFNFEAEGTFTERDIENRSSEAKTMTIEANLVDIKTDIGMTVVFGSPWRRINRAVTMSAFKGEVPLTAETKEGDPWKLAGTFQIGCTADGKVFSPTGSKVNRLSGAIQFPGDRTFNTTRIECVEASATSSTP